MRIIAAALVLSVTSTSAMAYCSSPNMWDSAPSPPSSISRPDVPYCLSSYAYSGKHTCDQWELDSYFEEVKDYIEELEEYHRDAVEFANAAIDFSNQALAYAQCESKEVGSQHE